MTKSELIDALASRADIPKSSAALVVNCVFDSMAEAMRRGESVEIRGFGSFVVRTYEPYAGRNPRTGETVEVHGKRAPHFKVGKDLKALVNSLRHIALDDDDEGGEDSPSAETPVTPR